MPSELPTIASCPHCGLLLLRTPRALVHPMAGERDRIRRALGKFWFEHARVRYDGRFHRCPHIERAEARGAGRAHAADGLVVCLVATALGLLVPHAARAQQGLDRLLGEGAAALTREIPSRSGEPPLRFPSLEEDSAGAPGASSAPA